MKRTLTAGVLAAALIFGLALPTSAFFRKKDKEPPEVADVTKTGERGGVITFSAEDFRVEGDGTLTAVIVESLPDPAVGTLLLGGQILERGSRVERSALSGLRFQFAGNPKENDTDFSLIPVYSDGRQGDDFEVEIILTDGKNNPPVARNMELSTYKNVSLTGYFDAVDAEGDILTFQMTSNPARGAVTLAEDGSGQFVYRPYENKTGKDSFTYAARDAAGNLSAEATVTIRIEKADTPVNYAGLDGHPAHKSAVRLAEEGVYVGPCMGGSWSFDADAPVTRAEFLAMAMAAAGIEPMEDVRVTGFADDAAIPVWSKGSISAALKAGAIRGGRDETGAPIFGAEEIITAAQAAVMLDSLFQVTDVPLEVFAASTRSHWAGQAAANLAACGVIRGEDMTSDALAQPLTLGETAVMLDAAMELRENR